MIKQTPSFGRIFAMVAFTLSCFGILVFLWLNFGGSVPLQPEGYRVQVGFPSATQLAQEADVVLRTDGGAGTAKLHRWPGTDVRTPRRRQIQPYPRHLLRA